eukprot:365072-Chlamydomonas_euryale.AAC.26
MSRHTEWLAYHAALWAGPAYSPPADVQRSFRSCHTSPRRSSLPRFLPSLPSSRPALPSSHAGEAQGALVAGRHDAGSLPAHFLPACTLTPPRLAWFVQRFLPVTLEKPKALLPLVNVPMIEYTLHWLASNGVEEAYVFCSSHADQIKAYLDASCTWGSAGDGGGSNMQVRCKMRWRVKGLQGEGDLGAVLATAGVPICRCVGK